MLRMVGFIAAAAAVTLSAAAPAQVTSYKTDNAAPLKGEAEKIVCKKEEKIGTRLGAKKVCLTVTEWNDLTRAHRERTERIQSSTCQVGEGQACSDPLN